jgi:serine/threonine-protein kinase
LPFAIRDTTFAICFTPSVGIVVRLRFRDAADIGIELEEVLTAPALEGHPSATLKSSVPRGWRRAAILSLGTLLLGAAVASLVVWNLRPTLPRPVNRSVITLPPGQQLAGLDDGPAVAISPDGGQLVYVARQAGLQQLYLRSLDSLQATPISGTEGAVNPFFSPDGRWVGFFSGGKLKKISTNGGAALTLQDAPVSAGASWSSRGVIAFAPIPTSVLQQVSDAGGIPQPVTRFENGELAHRWRSSCQAAERCSSLPARASLIGPTHRLRSCPSEPDNDGT